eukprot:gene3889-7762_t
MTSHARDSGGNIRNISRDIKRSDTLAHGTISHIQWDDICKCITPKSAEDFVNITLADTIVYTNGSVYSWLYTDEQGRLQRKPQSQCTGARIQQDFYQYYSSAHNTAQHVALLHSRSVDPTPIRTEDFVALCHGRVSDEIQAMQIYIPSKTDPLHFRSFRTECRIDDRMLITMQTKRLDVTAAISGSGSISSKTSMNKKANEEMESMCRIIISRVEHKYGCRVVRMTGEFVQDKQGRIWMVRATDCTARNNLDQKRSISPVAVDRSRMNRFQEGFDDQDDDEQYQEQEQSDLIPGFPSASRDGGDRSRDRNRDRDWDRDRNAFELAASRDVDDMTLDSRGGSKSKPRSRQRQGTAGGPRPISSESQVVRSAISPLPRIPNARLSNDVVLKNGNNIFGSCQRSGCQGDFCTYDISFIDRDVGDRNINDREEFRRGLMSSDKTTSYKIAGESLLAPLSLSMSRKQSPVRGTNLLDRSQSPYNISPTRAGTHNNPVETYLIPFRLIIQTRQEESLVKLLLTRRKRGEDGDYVSEASYSDLALSLQLPEMFSKEVECCSTCYKIYQVIEKARSRAVRKLMTTKKRPRHSDIRSKSAENLLEPDLFSHSFSGENSAELLSSAPHSAGGGAGSSASDGFERDHGFGMGDSMFSNAAAVSVSSPITLGRGGSGGGRGQRRDVKSRQRSGGTESRMSQSYEQSVPEQSLQAAIEVIDSLTKLDVAEIRTMSKPPAAVEVVVEAVMAVLLGKVTTFAEARRLMGGGESFLVMLREFRLEDITEARLRLIEPYVDNPLFRPENVAPVSYCASKFCAWVLGVVQAARWQRGVGHRRTNLVATPSPAPMAPLERSSLDSPSMVDSAGGELTFVQKLERKKKQKKSTQGDMTRDLISRQKDLRKMQTALSTQPVRLHTAMPAPELPMSTISRESSVPSTTAMGGMSKSNMTKTNANTGTQKHNHTSGDLAMQRAQKKAVDRLSSQNKANAGGMVASKEFRCRDGITKMPFISFGTYSPNTERYGFIVVQDFFDTCDATAINFKPIVVRHDGCQVLCFNYPGQANTVWPRPPPAERQRGAVEPVLNNDWIADRLHELLQFADANGDLILKNTNFHIVGIGNGACIASAFLQRWSMHELYSSSIRSLISINGFLTPDPQLSSILHSATQVFESTPHSRPDIPVSFWSRFIFSEDYLSRVHPNLALNIHTAITNPITSDGRLKLARGCLLHRDLRGGLNPDMKPDVAAGAIGDEESVQLCSVDIPIILLQSTDNLLVNAANVDPFLAGRRAKHLWSHQLNLLGESVVGGDVTSPLWVGRRSSGPADYGRSSILGKSGLRMLLQTTSDPRGAFVMWVKAGHVIQQENKTALLDLLDALACPKEEYYGIKTQERVADSRTNTGSNTAVATVPTATQQVTDGPEVMFRIGGPRRPVEIKVDAPGVNGMNEDDNDEEAVDENGIVSSSQDAGDESKGKFFVDFQIRVLKKSLSTFKADDQEWYRVEISKQIEIPLNRFEILGLAAGSVIIQSRAWFDTKEEADAAAARMTHTDFLSRVIKRFGKSEMNGAPRVSEIVGEQVVEEEEEEQEMEIDRVEEERDLMVAAEDAKETSNQSKDRGFDADNSMEQKTTSPKSSPMDKNNRTGQVSPSKLQTGSHTQLQDSDNDVEEGGETKINEFIPEPVTSTIEPVAVTTMLSDYEDPNFVSNADQRKKKEWVETVPSPDEALALERQLVERRAELEAAEERLRNIRKQEASSLSERLEREAELRRQKYEEEDRALVAKLERELEERRAERLAAEKQRRLQVQELEKSFVQSGVVPVYRPPEGTVEAVKEMPPMEYNLPNELPNEMTQKRDILTLLDNAVTDDADAKKRGDLSMDEYDQIKRQMALRQVERDERLRRVTADERDNLYASCAKDMQRVCRGFLGRKKWKKTWQEREVKRIKTKKVIIAQAVVRGFLARRKVRMARRIFLENYFLGKSAVTIQKIVRGHFARKIYRKMMRLKCAKFIQRVFRGYLGRKVARRERDRLELIRRKEKAALIIQSAWRMKVAREEFRSMKIHKLAAIEIQRLYRGHLSRKLVARRRKWEAAQPGPERIQLGLKLIEESKVAFERQQEEIDALHRAQEKAEARVSHIYADLKESEKELSVLERELQEIDHIEKDLLVLTHERELLVRGITNAAGMPRTAGPGGLATDAEAERRKKAEAYALEMTIQIKRAEREKKRQELETEFASVFQEVEKKKRALERLETSLADMESTRERKDREFRRLQRNLMQLLMEQKRELDDLRERGIELETATATTAAAATATAMKAKEHEKRSAVMFSQTEELMKFQFMSMSLSYFSSLNMLKQLRDMNADTTSAAVSSSADAAAAAAASATAANLPQMRKLDLGAGDFVELNIQKKKAELASMERAEKEVKKSKAQPLPDAVRLWTVDDVCRWLGMLSLNQYIPAFREATVDGSFLMELREEDLMQVLGIEHKLHVRKILVSREKLKPLTEQEKRMVAIVEHEAKADALRKAAGIPDLDTVFSQARNGRIKRLEESLNLGFPVDMEDERGHTLLLVAAQNSNKRMVEMLLARGANINHQNTLGNTALHYAMAFDTDGLLGEYLIERGADDTLENADGMTPYDGIGNV